MPACENQRHHELKRLALLWAQAQGFAAAATEVSLPHLRFRIDVAAYRAGTRFEARNDPRLGRTRLWRVPALGTAAVFECKQVRADFLRDSRRSTAILERLRTLHARKLRFEAALKIHYPSLRNGDSLFSEYETHDFERSGDELYLELLSQLRTLTRQLYEQTKFEKLTRWRAANLHYLVTEPDVLHPHEIPPSWGLLIRESGGLRLLNKPAWQEISDASRLTFLHRIAMAGTRAMNREHGVSFEHIAALRAYG
ncbi:MAG: hypothetical protein M3463_13015 [Verrucomicrobiota bacterium]|nr:hypothetical protein [Verrucomicrobiota bacterium]